MRPFTTSGKLLPKMANSGTLISTISMTSARNAMAVDDCIGRLAPSNNHRGRLRQPPLLAQFLGLPTGKADHIGGSQAWQCQFDGHAQHVWFRRAVR